MIEKLMNMDNYKVYVFDLDDTLYLHNADSVYKNEYHKRVKVFLEELKNQDKILCIATHNRTPNHYLERLEIKELFDEIIYEHKNVHPWYNCITEYTSKKDMLNNIIEKFDCNTDEIIFFDDNNYNIKEIQTLGIRSIKVSAKDGVNIEVVMGFAS